MTCSNGPGGGGGGAGAAAIPSSDGLNGGHGGDGIQSSINGTASGTEVEAEELANIAAHLVRVVTEV